MKFTNQKTKCFNTRIRVFITILLLFSSQLFWPFNVSIDSAWKHGTCGEHILWDLFYDDSIHYGDTILYGDSIWRNATLYIQGSGAMDNSYDCSLVYAPWFNDASKVYQTIIEDGLTTIGNYAFAWCEKMVSISIPNSVTDIGEHAFHECDQLSSIVLPDNLETINDYTFVWCDHMPKIDIPESVESIGIGAFTGCTALNTMIIPQGTSYIDLSAFSWCSNLKYLSIGENATNIGTYAFAWCENLKTILNHAPIPQIIGEDVFQGLKRSSCTLYVPSGSIDLYKNSKIWEDFIIRDMADAPEPNPTESFDLLLAEKNKIRKVLVNGQVYILRGDKIYNISGAEVK